MTSCLFDNGHSNNRCQARSHCAFDLYSLGHRNLIHCMGFASPDLVFALAKTEGKQAILWDGKHSSLTLSLILAFAYRHPTLNISEILSPGFVLESSLPGNVHEPQALLQRFKRNNNWWSTLIISQGWKPTPLLPLGSSTQALGTGGPLENSSGYCSTKTPLRSCLLSLIFVWAFQLLLVLVNPELEAKCVLLK